MTLRRSHNEDRRMRSLLAFSLVSLLACSPKGVSTGTPADAGEDDAVTPTDLGAPDVTPDVPSVSMDAPADSAVGCRSAADCPTGQSCSSVLRGCVECVADAECPTARPVCRGGACVARTVCESSRMCPGGVCDPASQSCVTCAGDVDCNAGERCVAHTCIATVACRSSVQCSALNMVCDTVAGRCVDCVTDADCGTGAFCSTGGVCRARVCVPSSATCADAMTVRTCDARGSMTTTMPCPSGQSCTSGRCAMRACTPGTSECVGTTGTRRCNADGQGYAPMTACAAGQVCSSGSCVTGACAPGSNSGCADASSVRVCNDDGLGFHNVACPIRTNAPAACVGGGCALVCTSGFGDCDGVAATGCEASLRSSIVNCGSCGRACPAGQICSSGVCTTTSTGVCPSSCSSNAQCAPCAMAGDTGNFCCISGLCLYMTGACGTTPVDAPIAGDAVTDTGGPVDSGAALDTSGLDVGGP